MLVVVEPIVVHNQLNCLVEYTVGVGDFAKFRAESEEGRVFDSVRLGFVHNISFVICE